MKSLAERLADNSEMVGDCREWTGTVDGRGYGKISAAGKTVAAHRAAMLTAGIALGPEQCALHRCDNPRCILPAHLFAGSRRDNMRDMVSKRRGRTNGKNNTATGDAIVIFMLAQDRVDSQRAIAKAFRKSDTCVYKIVYTGRQGSYT